MSAPNFQAPGGGAFGANSGGGGSAYPWQNFTNTGGMPVDPFGTLNTFQGDYGFKDPLGLIRSGVGALGYDTGVGSRVVNQFANMFGNSSDIAALYSYLAPNDLHGQNMNSWISGIINNMMTPGVTSGGSDVLRQLISGLQQNGGQPSSDLLKAFGIDPKSVSPDQVAQIEMQALQSAMGLAVGNPVIASLLNSDLGGIYQNFKDAIFNSPDATLNGFLGNGFFQNVLGSL